MTVDEAEGGVLEHEADEGCTLASELSRETQLHLGCLDVCDLLADRSLAEHGYADPSQVFIHDLDIVLALALFPQGLKNQLIPLLHGFLNVPASHQRGLHELLETEDHYIWDEGFLNWE